MKVDVAVSVVSAARALLRPPGDAAETAAHLDRAWQDAMERAQLSEWFKGAGQMPQQRDPGSNDDARNNAPGKIAAEQIINCVVSNASLRFAPPAESAASFGSARTPCPAVIADPSASGSLVRARSDAVNAEALRSAAPPSHEPIDCNQAAHAAAPMSADSAPSRAAADPQPQRQLADTHAEARGLVASPAARFDTTGAPVPARPGGTSALPGSHERDGAIARTAGEAPARSAALLANVDAPPAQLLAMPSAPLPAALAQQAGALLRAGNVEITESPSAPVWPSTRFRAAAEADAPTRLHVEWTAGGARLWLGVDQQQLPRVPALAGQLQQWLAASGVKLLALVCNGRAVYESSDEGPAGPPAPNEPHRRAARPSGFPIVPSEGDRE